MNNTMTTEFEDIYDLVEMLPEECVEECTRGGCNYRACVSWVSELGINIPKAVCVEWLKEFGAWEDDELEDMDQHELNIRAVWVAAGYRE